MVQPVSYEEFRTGLSYRDVYMMLWDRKYKRRHTVLGFWHQLKMQMYNQMLDMLE